MHDAIRKLLDDRAFKDYAALTKERDFNAFEVLRYSDYEIRHSNVFAWLLTPGETHGLGDAFLRRVGECLRKKKHSGKLKRFDVAAGFAAEDVRVERERDYVDVMVFVEKEPRVLLVVENKPCRRTPDHVKQLRGYVEEQCEKHGASYSVQGVLLTASRSGDRKHRDYLHLSWHEVRHFVGSFLEEGRVSTDEVTAFLSQYIDIVDRNILGRGPSGDCFRRLLKDHGATLEKMLPEWKPGAVPACWSLPPCDEDAVDSLLRDFRQRPAALRVRVKEFLEGEDFGTGLSAAPGGTAYWLSFWDDCWSRLAEDLGLPGLGWSFEFTHRGVAVHLSGGRVTGDQRRAVRRMMRFMQSVPVLEMESGEFTLRIDTLGYASFYRRELLTEADFADASPEEVQGRTVTEARTFLDSADYKRIRRYFEVLVFRPSPT